MTHVAAFAAARASAPLAPFTVERRAPGAHDVALDILFCGVCHSDIHQARDEWGGAIFPMVPGHEIVGQVTAVGGAVTRWRVGDRVGVGCFVDSCRQCEACRAGEEQYCQGGMTLTYNGRERDGATPTYGGYSTALVVDEGYLLRIPAALSPAAAAPLLCAGVTTWSPLKHFLPEAAGKQLAVIGLGGLGHMAVKLGRALGAEVTVLSHSPRKEADARRLGAHDFVATRDPEALAAHGERFDLIIDTVSAAHDYGPYLKTLRRDRTMVLVGLPDATPLGAGPLIMKRRRLAGSVIGGIKETQEMLDFCGAHEIAADVEVIAMGDINAAWERVLASDVRYRFVIDLATLR